MRIRKAGRAWRAPVAFMLLSSLTACLGGPTIVVQTPGPTDRTEGASPLCTTRLHVENGSDQVIDILQVAFGYRRDADGTIHLASLETAHIGPGESRTVEGQLVPAWCSTLEPLRDPLVTLCRQGERDCRDDIAFSGG